MLTAHDKAIVAFIMGAIQILNVLGFHIGLDESTVTTIVSVLSPVLVWLIPNKTA